MADVSESDSTTDITSSNTSAPQPDSTTTDGNQTVQQQPDVAECKLPTSSENQQSVNSTTTTTTSEEPQSSSPASGPGPSSTEDNGQPVSAESNIDPYAYLKRDEFTSEIFKIEIMNLPKRFGMAVSI